MMRGAGAAAVLFASAVAAGAADMLTGADFEREFSGHAIKGYYVATRVTFVEVYQPGGRIAYKDDLKADGGRWFVAGDTFCTFYDRINGGCWRVIKKSVNCYEFHQAGLGETSATTREALLAQTPHARAARDADQVTCEQWFGS
jgi:hypothetical protein